MPETVRLESVLERLARLERTVADSAAVSAARMLHYATHNSLGHPRGEAVASSDLTLSTTLTDVPGASVVVPSSRTAAVALVWGVFDFDVTATGAAIAQGIVDVNGVASPGNALHSMLVVTRHTVMTCDLVPLSGGAGNYTWKLRALKSAAVGTCAAKATHSRLVVVYID